jgi:hypothetical protein
VGGAVPLLVAGPATVYISLRLSFPRGDQVTAEPPRGPNGDPEPSISTSIPLGIVIGTYLRDISGLTTWRQTLRRAPPPRLATGEQLPDVEMMAIPAARRAAPRSTGPAARLLALELGNRRLRLRCKQVDAHGRFTRLGLS